MSAYSIRKKETTANNQKVDVLYQRIGGKWYAFSANGEDVFFGSIPDEVIAELDAEADSDGYASVPGAIQSNPRRNISSNS